MASKYPPSERVSAGRLAVGDGVLIRERQSDQPIGTCGEWDQATRTYARDPFASGVWTVTATTSRLTQGHRRASRVYTLTLEHPGAGVRTIDASASERFNRTTSA